MITTPTFFQAPLNGATARTTTVMGEPTKMGPLDAKFIIWTKMATGLGWQAHPYASANRMIVIVRPGSAIVTTGTRP
jgi:hypothetical protein